MTAKEKAESIFHQMYKILWHTNAEPIHCKQCATILVDEMIDYLAEWADEDGATLHVIYLSQVKNEIIKL